MGKFNNAVKGPKTRTTNLAGGEAFSPLTDEMALYMQVCASFMSGDGFYKTEGKALADLRETIHKCDRKFVLQLANYARNEMKLRTMPIILLAEASMMYSGNPNESKRDVREYCQKILKRADEPGELISYWVNFLGNNSVRKLPNALKKGIADTIHNFNEYQLAKYNRSSAEFKLHDIFNLVHPKPRNEAERDLFARVVEDRLKTPDTWETKISQEGSTSENWNDIAPKMGTMALMRNLRNFEQKNATKAIDEAVKRFRNKEAVLQSRILPFRWLAADKEVTTGRIKDALRDAVDISVANIPKWEGNTAIFVDLSGSMDSPISGKSKMSCREVASLMGAMAHGFCDQSFVGAFGELFKPVSLSTRDSVLTNSQKISHTNVGHSTNAWKGIEYATAHNLYFDQFVVFTDLQIYDDSNWGTERTARSEFQRYKREVNPNAKIFMIDLHSYGTLSFPEADRSAVHLCGFSEKLFDFIPEVSKGNSAVNLIKQNY